MKVVRGREAVMRQGITLPQTPRERRDLEGLAADLQDSPVAGRPLPVRLRNFRPSADRYLASLGGPLAYMVRLRQIDRLVAELESALSGAWHRARARLRRRSRRLRQPLARDRGGLGSRRGERPDRDATIAGIPSSRDCRWIRKTRDYALVNGKDYRLACRSTGVGCSIVSRRVSTPQPPPPIARSPARRSGRRPSAHQLGREPA